MSNRFEILGSKVELDWVLCSGPKVLQCDSIESYHPPGNHYAVLDFAGNSDEPVVVLVSSVSPVESFAVFDLVGWIAVVVEGLYVVERH